MTTEKRLQEAIKDGEVLTVIYQGGSQPGALRKIAPISVKDGKVRARCLSSNAVKLFALDKINIIDEEMPLGVTGWQQTIKSITHYESISVLLEKKREFLEGLGWHIDNNLTCISLHRCFKNGKPFKSSDVSLGYEEYRYDMVVGLDGELCEEKKVKSHRPWTIRGKNKDTKTFGSLDKAAEVFLEWANLLAPFPK